jgi:predicted nucleic acid-binding protein
VSNGEPSPVSTPMVDVVVDASVAVKWFVPEDNSSEALLLLNARFRRHVPVLLQTEAAQTVWKKVYQRRELTSVEGRDILDSLMTTSMEIYDVTLLLGPAFDIALATGRTVYDSVYLALAVALGCKLVTADKKLYNALSAGPFAGDVLWVADLI